MGRARSSNLHATGARAARSENQSRGTELSGAETGGENPPERPLLSGRDREREKEAARCPAETASFRLIMVSEVREGWVVGATGIEAVTPSMSTRCSPAELRALKPQRVGRVHRLQG